MLSVIYHKIQTWIWLWWGQQKTWWRHQLETFSALLALCAGNSLVTAGFPSQRAAVRSFDIFFDQRLNDCWVNDRDVGDLGSHRAHYDVTVISNWMVSIFGTTLRRNVHSKLFSSLTIILQRPNNKQLPAVWALQGQWPLKNGGNYCHQSYKPYCSAKYPYFS